jgi:hypothetical protein
MRSGGSEPARARNSASSFVKMSLVIAAISKRSRKRRQSASTRAVLPEPTGPPMPTRNGPWGLFM